MDKWSLLFSVILCHRFNEAGSGAHSRLELIALKLSIYLIGRNWQAIRYEPTSFGDVVIYCEFDLNWNLQQCVVRKTNGKKGFQFDLQNKDDLIDCYRLLSTLPASSIKLVSTDTLPDSEVLFDQFMQVHKEVGTGYQVLSKTSDNRIPKKRLRKLFRDPVLFLADSKWKLVRSLAGRWFG